MSNDYIRSYIYVLECSIQRMKWYSETNDPKFLEDSQEFLSVANIYANEIIGNTKDNHSPRCPAWYVPNDKENMSK